MEQTFSADSNQQLVSEVKKALSQLDYDVTIRNDYINVRDRALYSDGLFADLDIEGWFAEYNYCRRVVDIHAAQLMGRGFGVFSRYEKEESDAAMSPEEENLIHAKNQKKQALNDMRNKAVAGIIRDNGGFDLHKRGARIGSGAGTTVFKQWANPKAKRVEQRLLENVQNFRAGWTDNDFRERDFDAFVYQISVDKAYREYGSKLPDGELFSTSQDGQPFMDLVGDGNTADPLSQNTTDRRARETARPMVTVIEITGYLCEWGVQDGKVVKVSRGKEKPFNLLIVGGQVVQTITDEKRLPKYYIIPNRSIPGRAWGESDLPQSAIDINKEIIQLMADQMTWANKNLFRFIQAKGFAPQSIPKKKARKTQVIAMSPEQELSEMTMNPVALTEFQRLVEQRLDAFVRLTGVGRVLFDDPTVNADSNQALMTTLKGVVDIVEDKQSRWEIALREMYTDALQMAASFIPELREAVDEANWYLCIEWPSVLRKEDSAYQQMLLNWWNAGVLSFETLHEKLGSYDSSEEEDRLSDDMRNPVLAAVLGKQLPLLAQQVIVPQPPMAPGAGMASPPDQAQPTLTADQNTGQTASQPGSGAPAVSPEAAIAMAQQNQGQ